MTETKKLTKSQEAAADVAFLLRARYPLLWVVTREEARVEGYLVEAALAAKYVPRTWDVGQGVADVSGKVDPNIGSPDSEVTLSAIERRAKRDSGGERGAWIMRDLPPWLAGPIGMKTLRMVRNLARLLPTVEPDNAQALIVISPSAEVPPELADHATVIDWPLPDRAEIEDLLDDAVNALATEEVRAAAAPRNGERSAAVDAAVGLTGEEASSCYAKSLVQLGRIDPVTVSKEKRRVIARERVLEWCEPLEGGLDAVGGLEGLKSWLRARSAAYSPAAVAYGLPAPRGMFLAGISGCGKTLTAKATATALRVPLLRFDPGALKSKFVGDSEANIRKAFKVIEAIGPCVVWIDEIDKALQGATSGSADGGVAADALGSILSWMQERSGRAFVIATANDVTGLPPELLRKGRFDELFFVDLPTPEEREAVLAAALRAHKRDARKIDAARVAAASDKFTGSEIAALVPEAMYRAFADGARAVTTEDLVAVAGEVTPLSTTMSEKLTKMREWGAARARPAAGKPEATAPAPKAVRRRIDA